MKHEIKESTIEIEKPHDFNTSLVTALHSNLPTLVDSHINILTSRIFVIATSTNDILIGIKHDDEILRTINGTIISFNNEEGTINAIGLRSLQEHLMLEMQATIGQRITKKDLRELERIIKEINNEKHLVKTSQMAKVLI